MGEFFGEGWRSGPLRQADSFWRRWRGLRPRPSGFGLWLAGSSVHGLGMKEPVWVCGLDHDRMVVAVKTLLPGRVVRIAGASTTLELPHTNQPPAPGTVLTWLDARDADPLRYANR